MDDMNRKIQQELNSCFDTINEVFDQLDGQAVNEIQIEEVDSFVKQEHDLLDEIKTYNEVITLIYETINKIKQIQTNRTDLLNKHILSNIKLLRNKLTSCIRGQMMAIKQLTRQSLSEDQKEQLQNEIERFIIIKHKIRQLEQPQEKQIE